MRASDPDLARFCNISARWYANFRDRLVFVSQVIRAAFLDATFEDALLTVAATPRNQINPHKLGNYLRRNRNARRGGFHLEGVDPRTHHEGVAWRVRWTGAPEDAPDDIV
jgi:hypothetical protein